MRRPAHQARSERRKRQDGTRLLARHQLGLALADSGLWALGIALATWGRFDFDWSRVQVGRLWAAVGIAVLLSLVCGFGTGLYLGRRRLGSAEEASSVAVCSGTATLGLTALIAVAPDPHLVPLSAALAGGAYQLITALGVRYVLRVVSSPRPRRQGGRQHRALVYGAGDAGSAIAKALFIDEHSDLLPVAFLDDDPAKANLRLHGLPVVGGRADLGGAAAAFDADTLLIAMPSAPHEVLVAAADMGRALGLAVKILPSARQRIRDGSELSAGIREFTIADYLGREEVRIDIGQVASYVTGRRVLVTGAGGFIGSALCEAIIRFGPRRLTLVDHDENALHALGLRLSGVVAADSIESVLADIRDRAAVWRHFADATPDVVFHVAAHKHVEVLERYPAEAYRTNVVGTCNVLEAAASAGTERFVNVSTDKAADPIGVLGASKRIGEMVTAHFAEVLGRDYMTVRFGNVLGSTGSVLHTFRHQVMAGLPLTVTHPDVSRYFMTADEAVRLVVQAAAVGRGGDVLVFDMGEPVRIVDLAERLAAEMRPGWEPEIVFIGLRDGEKLVEDLVSSSDTLLDRPHERVRRYQAPMLDPAEALGLDEAAPAEMLKRRMLHLAGGAARDVSDVPR